MVSIYGCASSREMPENGTAAQKGRWAGDLWDVAVSPSVQAVPLEFSVGFGEWI